MSVPVVFAQCYRFLINSYYVFKARIYIFKIQLITINILKKRLCKSSVWLRRYGIFNVVNMPILAVTKWSLGNCSTFNYLQMSQVAIFYNAYYCNISIDMLSYHYGYWWCSTDWRNVYFQRFPQCCFCYGCLIFIYILFKPPIHVFNINVLQGSFHKILKVSPILSEITSISNHK